MAVKSVCVSRVPSCVSIMYNNKMLNCRSFKIDSCTFLQVGLDPNNDFNSMICIIKKSNIITISLTFLKEQIFDNKNKIIKYLEMVPLNADLYLTDWLAMWIGAHGGDKHLCLQCLTQNSRIRLTKSQFLVMCGFEKSIIYEVQRQNKKFKPIAIRQLEELATYLNNNFPQKKIRSRETLVNIAQLIEENELKTVLSSSYPCFIGQIQFRATKQLVDRWLQLMSETHQVNYI